VRKIAHSKENLAPSLVGDPPSRRRATAARTTRGCAVPSPGSSRSRCRRNNRWLLSLRIFANRKTYFDRIEAKQLLLLTVVHALRGHVSLAHASQKKIFHI
jgi:hypothetical protein